MIIFSKVVLLPMLYLFAVSCTDRLSTNIGQVGQQTEKCTVGVRLQQEGIGVKSKDPGDENKISDINLFVYNSVSGFLEAHVYIDSRNYGKVPLTVDLLKNVRYDFAVCANFGFKPKAPESLEALKEMRFYLTYPDEYGTGIPMSGMIRDIIPKDDGMSVNMTVTRLMAKIGIAIDRSKLNSDVRMNVSRLSIGGCPKSAKPFADSKPAGRNDIFENGFFKDGRAADFLNIEASEGKSQEVYVYMLESLGGDRPSNLDNPAAAAIYPYIELKMDYVGTENNTAKWLVYRFCIGEKEGNSDIRRNTTYHFTVTPHGNGLDKQATWMVEFTN